MEGNEMRYCKKTKKEHYIWLFAELCLILQQKTEWYRIMLIFKALLCLLQE